MLVYGRCDEAYGEQHGIRSSGMDRNEKQEWAHSLANLLPPWAHPIIIVRVDAYQSAPASGIDVGKANGSLTHGWTQPTADDAGKRARYF